MLGSSLSANDSLGMTGDSLNNTGASLQGFGGSGRIGGLTPLGKSFGGNDSLMVCIFLDVRIMW